MYVTGAITQLMSTVDDQSYIRDSGIMEGVSLGENATNTSALYTYTNASNMTQDHVFHPQLRLNPDAGSFASVIELYVKPVLVITGALGNCLILLTVRQKNMAHWSVCLYLAAYAVGNFLILVPMMGAEWLCNITGTKYVNTLTNWTCKLWQFIMGVTIYSGIWFMFAMLVDQFILIWMPHKAQAMCTVFMAKFAIVIIMIGLTVISVHAIWTYELFDNGCFILHTPNDLLTTIWPWVTLCLHCVLPLLLIFVFICLVMYGVFTKSTWKKSSSNYQVPTDITIMIIVLSIVYVILVTPATVINVLTQNLPLSWLHDEEFYTNLITIVAVVGDLLTYLNPALAFFVCVTFSSTFRGELREQIRALCCDNVSRVYEMQLNAGHGSGIEQETCSETTPL